jgi:RimJ/RimL family protein N-acetyltransferase
VGQLDRGIKMNVQIRPLSAEHDGGYILQKIPNLAYCSDTTGLVAVDMDKNETIGVVIFDSWTVNSVQAHIIIDNPMVLRHGFLEEAFDFAFNPKRSDRKIITGLVKSNNKAAQKFDKHIGFEERYRIKDGFSDGVDLIHYEINRDNCRWFSMPEEKGVANA